jgi:Uma2 family endonuclease
LANTARDQPRGGRAPNRTEAAMTTATRVQPYTFEEFCFLVPDGQKADLIDGVIHMASPDTTDANELFIWLSGLIYDFAEVKELGRVYGPRVAVRLDRVNGPEPDIVFVHKSRLHRVKRSFVEGPADLVVEIVSPDSAERDYVRKRAQYEQAEIPEYWIVDKVLRKVTFLRLDTNRKYREIRLRQGELHSRALPGFWLRPSWLWKDTRPRKRDVLKLILGEG